VGRPGDNVSTIAYGDGHGKPVVVPNQENERITPSVVLFDGDNVIDGNTAWVPGVVLNPFPEYRLRRTG
jgi:molecular chaperone DnaK (HSP70)